MIRTALRRRGPVRRFGAFLALAALVLQLGLPLAYCPIELGFAGPIPGAPLCHVGGGGAGGHAPLPASSGQGTLCPICLGLVAASSTVLPPDPGGAVLAAVLAGPSLPLPPREAHRALAPRRAAQPRAPPVFA